MGKFRIIPSIYLYNGNVVDKETKEIVGDGDAVELARAGSQRRELGGVSHRMLLIFR